MSNTIQQATLNAIHAAVKNWYDTNFDRYSLHWLGPVETLSWKSRQDYLYKYEYVGMKSWCRGRYDTNENSEIYLDLGQAYDYSKDEYALDTLSKLCRKLSNEHNVDIALIHNGYGNSHATILIGKMKNTKPKLVYKTA